MARSSSRIPRHVLTSGHATRRWQPNPHFLFPSSRLLETAWYNFAILWNSQTTIRLPCKRQRDRIIHTISFNSLILKERWAFRIGHDRASREFFTRKIFDNIWTANVILPFHLTFTSRQRKREKIKIQTVKTLVLLQRYDLYNTKRSIWIFLLVLLLILFVHYIKRNCILMACTRRWIPNRRFDN